MATQGSPINLYEAVTNLEMALIKKALTAALGNRTHAARLLCIKRSTLQMKMKKYGMMAQDYSGLSNQRHDKS